MAQETKQAFTEPGRRASRPRRLVRDALEGSDAFISALEIFEAICAGGERVSLSTVYRNLQEMADAGELDVLRADANEARYRKCGPQHHHHLVCRECGRAVEVNGPTVERWATTTAARHGFVQVSHNIELFGLCGDCAGRRPGR